jgi:hypothetical protein
MGGRRFIYGEREEMGEKTERRNVRKLQEGMDYERSMRLMMGGMTRGNFVKNDYHDARSHWKIENGQVAAYSWCWLFCWAYSGNGSTGADRYYNSNDYAIEAREVWNNIFQVPFLNIAGGDRNKLRDIYIHAQRWREQKTPATEKRLNELLEKLGEKLNDIGRPVLSPGVGNLGPSIYKSKNDNEEIDEIEHDIETIENLPVGETEKLELVKTRVGQGTFRERVLELYNHRCVVTGVNNDELLIASHIIAWKDCTGERTQLRLDGENGLLLSPHLDKLFDKYLISFKDDGTMLVNPCCKEVLETWKIKLKVLDDISFPDKTKEYLKWHNQKYYEKQNNGL